MRFTTYAYVAPPTPLPAGIPVGYGDGTQADAPGPWAFLSGIYETDYTTSTPDTTVTNQTELDAAILTASAGDVIRIADGNYTDLTVTDSDFASRVTFEAESYQGAVFSGNVVATRSDNVCFRGMKASTIQHVACNNVAVHYTQCRTILSQQDTDDSSMYSGIEWYGCLADRAWPSPADKGVAGFIRQMNGGFSGTFVDGPQQGTIKKCIFMRSTEDNFKHTWASDVGYDQCVFWGCQVDSVEGDALDIHPDSFQSSGVLATGAQIPNDVTMYRCGFINLTTAENDEGQGMWSKDGTHNRWTWSHCIGTSGLNSIAFSTQNAHQDSTLSRCSTTQNIRLSNASVSIEDSIYGVNLVDYVDGNEPAQDIPADSGNRTFGYDEPTDIFSTAKSGAAWEPENFLPTLETDFDTVGATDALTLINSRMVAAGQAAFIPTGWV